MMIHTTTNTFIAVVVFKIIVILAIHIRNDNNDNSKKYNCFVYGQGLAPPHPNWIDTGTYESVLHIRQQTLVRRQGQRQRQLKEEQDQQQQYNNNTDTRQIFHDRNNNNNNSNNDDENTYIAKYMSTEYCRYMPDKECQSLDEFAKQTSLLYRNNSFNENKTTMYTIGPVAEYNTAIQSFQNKQRQLRHIQQQQQQQQTSIRTNNTTITNTNTTTEENNNTIVSSKMSFQSYEQEQKEMMKRKLLHHRQHHRKLAPNPSIASSIRVLVLLVRFKDHTDRILPTKEYINTILNGDGTSTTNPIGSMKEWLRFNSLGQYRVAFTVTDWYTSNQTEYETAANVSALYGASRIQSFFTSILNTIDTSNTIDWSKLNYVDEFGIFYHLVVLHSGYAAEMGPINCITTLDAQPKNRIWSQGMWGTSYPWTSKNFFILNGFAITSVYDYPACDDTTKVLINPLPPAQIGQIVHEYNHGFGVPDLYDQDTDSKLITLGGTGKFGIMSNGFGWQRNSAKPGHHDPYTRIKLGWLTPIEIKQNGYYAIQPSEISGQVYILKHNFPLNEYLLIENRQPIKWDSDMPSTTGIVIWHIDEYQNGQRERGIPGDVNFPTHHYMVSVVQADRNYDIEKGINIGDDTDYWNYNQTLSSGGSFPNTDSIQFGERKSTGLSITITSSSSFIMTFQIQGINSTRSTTSSTSTNRTNRTTKSPNDTTTTTSSTVKWILSMFIGTAAMMGLLVILFV